MAGNGGIIGPVNTISKGDNTQTTITSSGPTSPALATTQPGTRLIKALIVAVEVEQVEKIQVVVELVDVEI